MASSDDSNDQRGELDPKHELDHKVASHAEALQAEVALQPGEVTPAMGAWTRVALLATKYRVTRKRFLDGGVQEVADKARESIVEASRIGPYRANRQMIEYKDSYEHRDCQRAVLDQVFTTHDFPLASGRILPELRIAYETYGTPVPDQNNTVLLAHGYTSNHHMIGRRGSTLAEGLWHSLVGPGKAIDTNRLFVVSSNMLGSSYGSTGPAQRDPVTGRPYGPDFPDISLVDIVTAQRALLKHLGINHLLAVIGPSYGGFQAFQWTVAFPDFVDGIVPVTTDFKAQHDSMADLNALIARLERDPNWHGGHYYDHGGVRDTMTQIRIQTLTSYGIHEHLAADLPEPATRQAEIERLAHTWATEFDANSLIVLGRASALFNVEKDLSRIRARVLYVLSRTDKLFPPSLAPGVMAKLRESGVRAEYFEIDSELGHAASGLDGAKWAPKLAEFLAQLEERR